MINQENNDLYDLNEALQVENLTLKDYEEICKRLNRKPNRTELGMFGVMWSEQCCYRNSKPLLSQLFVFLPHLNLLQTYLNLYLKSKCS